MTPNAIDAYVRRLERELRQRGLEDDVLLEEVSAHLVDAIADAQRRGLSLAEAEREAFERLGAPEIVAAHALQEGNRTMTGFTAALNTAWQRKWWILAPTVVAAVITSVASYHFLPTRYRSEATMIVVRPQMAGDYPRAHITGARFQQISQHIMSRTRLERIVRDYGLNQGAPIVQIVEQMRKDIDIEFLGSPAEDAAVRISFLSGDPQTAKTITERLMSFANDETLRDSLVIGDGAGEFIEAQIEDVRRRIIDAEQNLEGLRARSGGRHLSQADVLPYEVLQERYRALLIRREESKAASDVERRQIGEQFRTLDPPSLPERPDGLSRLQVNAAGSFAGLGLGVAFVTLRRRSTRDRDRR